MDEPTPKKPRTEPEGASPGPGTVAAPSHSGRVQDLMPMYYRRLFPYDDMIQWLAYGNNGPHPQADASFLQRRDFCFTLDGDIFVRYQSVKDAEQLRAELVKKCPAKIDIGPVYNVDPSKRQAYQSGGGFVPVERELVFDIDMDGYDDVRVCCKGSSLCHRCWPLLTMALVVIDRVLRHDFGFRHILWVFSGRRGVHCWVCDPAARAMADDARAAVAAYLEVFRGHDKGLAKVDLGQHPHPSVAESLRVLEAEFESRYLPKQRLLEREGATRDLLRYVPSEELQARLLSQWSSGNVSESPSDSRGSEMEDEEEASESVSVARWAELKVEVAKEARRLRGMKNAKGARIQADELERSLKTIVLAYTYPRLDIEVSRKMNHLLKAPFCVHPKTGKICVPIDPATALDFTPEAVPTVWQLVQELDQARASGVAEPGWEHTSMKGAVETFRRTFLEGSLESSRGALKDKTRAAVERNAAVLAF